MFNIKMFVVLFMCVVIDNKNITIKRYNCIKQNIMYEIYHFIDYEWCDNAKIEKEMKINIIYVI